MDQGPITGRWERRTSSGELYADGRDDEWDGRGRCDANKRNAKRCAEVLPSGFFFVQAASEGRSEAVGLKDFFLQTAQALYAYAAQSEGELSLSEGDVVELTPTGMDAAEGWAEVSYPTSFN